MTSNRKNKRIIRDHMERAGLNFLEAKLQLEVAGLIPKPGEPNLLGSSSKADRSPLGKVIAVTSARGGTGKSTIALALGGYLALSSKLGPGKPLKVLVLDMDLRDGQIGLFTDSWTPTVMKLLRDGTTAKDIEGAVIHNAGLSVDLLLAPSRPRSADNLTVEFYEELIGQLKEIYYYIVIDTAGSHHDPFRSKVAYPLADRIILLAENFKSTISASARWAQGMTYPVEQEGLGIPKDRIGIVLNKVLPGHELKGEVVLENAPEIPLIGSIPCNSKLFVDSANSGELERVLSDPLVGPELRAVALEIVFGDLSFTELPEIPTREESADPEGPEGSAQ